MIAFANANLHKIFSISEAEAVMKVLNLNQASNILRVS